MNDEEKKRVMALYGCDEDITSFLIYSGTRFGNTTKSKLKQGHVEKL